MTNKKKATTYVPEKFQDTSPLPVKTQVELSFPDAIREVLNGRKITRLEWNNNDYCLLKDSFLTIFTRGDFHQWIVNDGDLNAIDWVVLYE